MRTITIPDQKQAIAPLKKANYEVHGRQQIINFMVTNGMKDHPNFKEYWQEYLNYMMAYEKLKEEFYKIHIAPIETNRDVRWEVDFIYDEIRIYD